MERGCAYGPRAQQYLITKSLQLLLRRRRTFLFHRTSRPHSLNAADSPLLDESDLLFTGQESNSRAEDGIVIEIKKLGRNSRKVCSKVAINASLETVWSILTDCKKLVDIIPGLAVCNLIEKNGNTSRIQQVGQQNLPLGMKFTAKLTLDCHEKDLEILDFGKKRDIEFKMIEGDFQLYEGKWSIEQFNKPTSGDNDLVVGQEYATTLSYIVDIKPKPWMPFNLIEGRMYQQTKTNLYCIREEAQKTVQAR